MVTKFTRKELKRLERSEEEIALVMEYQKRLPILSDDDSSGFTIDARLLHEQLGVKKKFATWIKSNIKDYAENVDYITSSPRETDENNGKFTVDCDYYLTLDLAKEIAMFTGKNSQASEELKKTSRLVRQYFILMERIVIDNKEWLAVRDPEKTEYKKMSDEVNAWMLRNWKRKAAKADYAVEADMLNVIIFGKTSQQLKSELHIGTFDLLRDYLKKDFNEELLFLEIQNQILLQMDMGFTARKEMLERMYLAKFGKKAELNVA